MMTKIPEVLKSGSGKRWVWITGVVAIFALLFAIAWNIECERAVAPQELPGEARSFIAQHYPEENPVLVIKTLDELAVTYKVVFADGTQVKFRRNGMWREIKSRSRAGSVGCCSGADCGLRRSELSGNLPRRNRAYLPGMGSEVEQYDRIDLR